MAHAILVFLFIVVWVCAVLVFFYSVYHSLRFQTEFQRDLSAGMIHTTLNPRLSVFWPGAAIFWPSGMVPNSAQSHRRKYLWSVAVFICLCTVGAAIALLGQFGQSN